MFAKVVGAVLKIISLVVGILPIPDTFLVALDGVIAFIIELFTSASWFVPMDLLFLCLGIIWAVDNYRLLFDFVRWLIERIPFLG